MKRFSIGCGLVAVGLLGAACSDGGDGPAPFAEAPETLSRRLAVLLGSRVDAVVDGRTGKPYLYVALDDGKPGIVDVKSPSISFLAPLAADLGVSSLEKELGEPTSIVPASEETAGTLTYAQHVPGTNVPVFDTELVVSTRLDGSVAFVQPTIASGLARVGVNPAVSAGAARDALRRAVANAIDVEEPILGVSAHDLTNPRLAYRADVTTASGSIRATIDANDAKVIALEPRTRLGVDLAAAAASYYDHPPAAHLSQTDPRYVASAAYVVPYDDTNRRLRGPSAFGMLEFRNSTVFGAPVTVETSSQLGRALTCDKRGGEDASGIAVDAYHNVSRVLEAYRQRFGIMKLDPLGRSLTVVVHDNTLGKANAYFEPATFSIHFGDGERGVYEPNTPDPDSATIDPRYPNDKKGLSRKGWFKSASAATSVEIVAHEVGHVFADHVSGGMSAVGEGGAISEGVADLFASQVALDINGPTSRFWLYAEDQHYRGLPARNLFRPSEAAVFGPTAAHFTQMKSTSPAAEDWGNVHYNSTVISQPWLLMSWGGFNDVSKLGVTTEIGFERATRLYWETVKATRPWESSIKGFARKMISYQTGKLQQHPTRTDLQGRWVRDAVICAWTAVGALTPAETKASYGITCPSSSTLETTSCANKRDGLYCDSNPKLDGSFIECERASIKRGFQCASGSYCHRKTGSFDSPALTDASGRPTCFAEPQPL